MSKSKFHRKHYKKIATIFRRYEDWNGIGHRDMRYILAMDLAVYFKQDNPDFDWVKFVEACGLPEVKEDNNPVSEED